MLPKQDFLNAKFKPVVQMEILTAILIEAYSIIWGNPYLNLHGTRMWKFMPPWTFGRLRSMSRTGCHESGNAGPEAGWVGL